MPQIVNHGTNENSEAIKWNGFAQSGENVLIHTKYILMWNTQVLSMLSAPGFDMCCHLHEPTKYNNNSAHVVIFLLFFWNPTTKNRLG